jgi:hypothetical protein
MLKRFGTHLRGNVVGYLALFVVLGGSAVALPGRGGVDRNDLRKNVVSGKHIKPDSATGADVNEGTLDFTCATTRSEALGLCFDSTIRATTGWLNAFDDCSDEKGRLPSIGELAGAKGDLGYTGATPDLWTDGTWDDGAFDRANALDLGSNIPQKQPIGNTNQYVCVFPLVD